MTVMEKVCCLVCSLEVMTEMANAEMHLFTVKRDSQLPAEVIM